MSLARTHMSLASAMALAQSYTKLMCVRAQCVRPQATSVCCLKLLVYAALTVFMRYTHVGGRASLWSKRLIKADTKETSVLLTKTMHIGGRASLWSKPHRQQELAQQLLHQLLTKPLCD